ncbi:histidine phosphatase family protein [Pseudomonas sp. N3-W]|uniref:Histidine phosphatase family protein n=2 Tax=Pseudomonas TaxID=286 RepID=A0ABT6QHI5_9PSED|nr:MULTISPECIES: histidine phosphatase family protein [unclassified Pseudomonas]MDI2590250.1 histidine phosphatase family protein [Pseudomonas sp. 681]UWF52098.1 histidine phosphatase family protein [Pseudomonas sp. N3-W]
MRSRISKASVAGGVLIVAILVTAFFMLPRSPINLAAAGPQAQEELLRHWRAGEVVVLVRHAERCDRSSNPCLGPADGITKSGNEASATVGQGFARLGMSQTDVISSPVTRTRQTADALVGKDVDSQEWLRSCGDTLRNDVIAHKVAERNMVLVTHSGCISDFERQTGFKHAAASEYSSSLFVSMGASGQLKVLGILNPGDWSSLLSEKPLK